MEDDSSSLSFLDLLVCGLISMMLLAIILALQLSTGGIFEAKQDSVLKVRIPVSSPPDLPLPKAPPWAIGRIQVLFWNKANPPINKVEFTSQNAEPMVHYTIGNPIQSSQSFGFFILGQEDLNNGNRLRLLPRHQSTSESDFPIDPYWFSPFPGHGNSFPWDRLEITEPLLVLLRFIVDHNNILESDAYYYNKPENFFQMAVSLGVHVSNSDPSQGQITRSLSSIVVEIWAKLAEAKALTFEPGMIEQKRQSILALQRIFETVKDSSPRFNENPSWMMAEEAFELLLNDSLLQTVPILLFESRTKFGRFHNVYLGPPAKSGEIPYQGMDINMDRSLIGSL